MVVESNGDGQDQRMGNTSDDTKNQFQKETRGQFFGVLHKDGKNGKDDMVEVETTMSCGNYCTEHVESFGMDM